MIFDQKTVKDKYLFVYMLQTMYSTNLRPDNMSLNSTVIEPLLSGFPMSCVSPIVNF
jgi:hypothetical protein